MYITHWLTFHLIISHLKNNEIENLSKKTMKKREDEGERQIMIE